MRNMGDSMVSDRESNQPLLTNGHAHSPTSDCDVIDIKAPPKQPVSALKANGIKKSTRCETTKHHVKFSEQTSIQEVENCDEGIGEQDLSEEENTPTEVSDIKTVLTNGNGHSHFSILELDNDGYPVYDIEENPLFSLSNGITQEMKSTSDSANGYGGNRIVDGNEAKPPMYKGPVIRLHRWPSTDSYENPFQHDGELSKKADFIVKNSTISRTEVCIADPDKTKIPTTIGADTHGDDDYDPTPVPVQDEMLVQSAAPVAHAAPSSGAGDMVDGPTRPNDIGVKANGALDDSKAPGVVTPQSVSVEVGTADASKPEVQQAEQVKVPKKRGKCCVIQ